MHILALNRTSARELAVHYHSVFSHLFHGVFRHLASVSHQQAPIRSKDLQRQQPSPGHGLSSLCGVCQKYRAVIHHGLRGLSRTSLDPQGLCRAFERGHHWGDVNAVMDHATRNAIDPLAECGESSIYNFGIDRVERRCGGDVLHYGIGCFG